MIADFPALSCPLSAECSGCAWIDRPYGMQRLQKMDALAASWNAAGVTVPLPEIGWVGVAGGGLRDRVDLVIDHRSGGYRLGLFGRQTREVIDINSCPQLSPELTKFLEAFRRIPFGIERGSVRLRVSPAGDWGTWLDFANVDIKRLLEEGAALRALAAIAFVEMGQRRKALMEHQGLLKLASPVLKPWFETYLIDGDLVEGAKTERAIPIYTTVGGFTQPGFKANRALVRELLRQVKATGLMTEAASTPNSHPPPTVIEFGSGAGNLTFPVAHALGGCLIFAEETDALACQGLRMGALAAGLDGRITLNNNRDKLSRGEPVDMILVDPPRSGLKSFLDSIMSMSSTKRPSHFVYVSCSAESFAADCRRLVDAGYRPKEVSILDQFPQTPHFEIVARLMIER